ncbi:hypothetical protein AVW11_07845 [Streptomyces amritsarensis]|uniref:Uncharacterized protein n=1 Tax=Streptomyces amritsarensis TaxID=681158 RepID=A0ABX3GAE9_9ACTN|nr:hypothetical protein [Streptomyces amritsarensis]OLZ70746.1 hypothetical protein AVW11_07845 [Streptomyces amritsarensis]
MVSVSELKQADPQKWRSAADDAVAVAKQCDGLASYARQDVARTVDRCWVGEAGRAATERFVKHADDYETSALALRAMAKVYDDLAEAITGAQRDLNSALDYARARELKVDDSGRVQLSKPVMVPQGSTEHLEPVNHAQGVITEALRKAGQADVDTARALRTIEGLTAVSDPKLAKEALTPGSPLAVALALAGGTDGLHPINVSPAQFAAVNRAAAETGISRKLLLAILWQEQQWYQNFSPGLTGPLAQAGRIFNWTLQQTLKPDKSLGITHMKPDTARAVMGDNRRAFTLPDGTFLGDLDDAQLTKYIEENPDENIRMSAYHLQRMQEEPYGARTDKQLFTLYAADTPEVRELNEQYGDESGNRAFDIKTRGENWDRLEPHLDDAMAWHALTEEQRATAVRQLESQTPAGHHVSVDPIYHEGGGPHTGTGTGPAEPGTPSPSPGPAPTPPRSN